MIRSIWLKNAGPFRGVHRVDLGPKAYAITARYETDPGRSNWGGKSFLVEMIEFPLTGRLKKQRRFDADGWITRGERDAFAGIELEDGAAIVRSRRRGRPTQIRFKKLGPDDDREEFFRVMSLDERPPPGCAAQEDAEVEMRKHLAFDADDFRNVVYVESKQAARLIHTEPEKRLDVVRGWLGIEKAERAEDSAQRDVTATIRKVKELRTRRAIVAERLKVVGEPADPKPHEERAAKLAAEIDAVRDEIDAMRARHEEMRAAESLVKMFDNLVSHGKKLAADVAKIRPVDQIESAFEAAVQRRDRVRIEHAERKRETETRRRVSFGQFDGRCPVADIECPAKKKINDDRDAARKSYETAKEREEGCARNLAAEERAALQLADELDEAREKTDELDAARKEARDVADNVKSARKILKRATSLPNEDELYERERALRNDLDTTLQAVAQIKADNKHHDLLRAEEREIEEKLSAIVKQAAVATQTRAVFRSTQRRVAERALNEIGTRANAMLSSANVDLHVDARWEYEGKGLASACEDCGGAFPKSAKAKICDECGALRGQNIIRRLEFIRSDQSDGADDLAGVSLQLAAGSWLLSSRQSPWATAILDEPFAAVDKSNRKSMAGALARLLGTGAWRQAIVISHSSDTADAFPGRIEIVVAKDGARYIRQP